MSRSFSASYLWPFLMLCFFLTGCKQAEVISPVDGQVYADTPSFEVTFSGGTPTLVLNGTDVLDRFTLTETNATASAAELNDVILAGDNLFKVNEIEVNFYVDRIAPEVHVTAVTEGNPLLIEGYVADRSGSAQLVINSNSIVIDASNRFSASIPDSTFIEIYTVDNLGNSGDITLARPGTLMQEAAAARVTQSGVNSLINAIADAVTALDIGALLAPANPIFDDCFFGACATISAVTATLGDTPVVDLDVLPTNDNRFAFVADLPQVNATTDGTIRVLGVFPVPADGSVFLSNLHVEGVGVVDVDSGEITVEAIEVDSEITGLDLNINALPDVLVDLVLGILGPMIENIFENELSDRVPTVVKSILDAIPTDLVLSLNGRLIDVNTTPSYLQTDNQSILLGLDGVIQAESLGADIPGLGSTFVDAPMPTVPSTTRTGDSVELVAVISSNVLNQALLAAHNSGFTAFEITTTGDGLPVANGDDVVDTDLIRVLISPKSPPVGQLSSQGAGVLGIGMQDFNAELLMKRVGWDDYRLIFGAELNFDANVDVGVSEDNFLNVSVIGAPNIEVLSVDDSGVINWSEAFIQDVIDNLGPNIAETIASSLGSVPVPNILGYTLFVREISATDTAGNYLTLAGDLVKVEEQAETLVTANTVNSKGSLGLAFHMTPYVGGAILNMSVASDSAQFQYRIGSGDFSVWSPNTTAELDLDSGSYLVTVCARTVETYYNPECRSGNISL
ncbi:MAG: hypothetical protein MI867_10295 [Pseudomonadales bacterium]|nr:hypothetical protein [Pseudomonadales bacterium]